MVAGVLAVGDDIVADNDVYFWVVWSRVGWLSPKIEYPVNPKAAAPAIAIPYLMNFLLDESCNLSSVNSYTASFDD
jgi:hypothetical protein